jgi:sigma-B regulation protein RsbU (phosphoserine phosphatase)
VTEPLPPAQGAEPAVSTYQRALDGYRRGADFAPALGKRMSELISLLDLSTTLSSSLSGDAILEAALLIVMGELQATRGCILVRVEDRFEPRAQRGFTAPPAAQVLEQDQPEEDVTLGGAEELGIPGLKAVCLVRKAGRVIAVIGLAARADGSAYTGDDAAFLRNVAACAATPIENGLIYQELKQLNRRLSLKVFQLHNLFDISRELSASQDEESIKGLVTTALMGQLLVSRCALYLRTDDELVLAQERGLRMDEEGRRIALADAAPALEALGGAEAVADLAAGPLRDALLRHRLALAVPLSLGERAQGLFAVGERASGAPFAEEDRDFAFALGRQALGALESVRLHRIRAEKERQDRELQFAREIQRSLFPPAPPAIPGLELAAVSVPSQEVGGDHYDFIPLPGGRLAITVADVSGKGTPASLLMASVHASLRALAGTMEPAALLQRLNRFLYDSTQAHRYVTMFYAELDPAARRMVFVNAGHVPPCVLSASGEEVRLTCGGPVVGLLEDVSWEIGWLDLTPGDLIAMVSDGVTEACSPDDREFGERRLFESLRRSRDGGAEDALGAIVDAVHAWTGPAGCGDDLTAVILKAM